MEITISEAAKLSNRNPSAIRTKLKKWLIDVPNAEKFIRKVDGKFGPYYVVDKDFYFSHMPPGKSVQNHPPHSDERVAAIKKDVDKLCKRISEQDKEIEIYRKQISELTRITEETDDQTKKLLKYERCFMKLQQLLSEVHNT